MCILAAERSAKEVRLNQLLYTESQTCLEYKKKVGNLDQKSKCSIIKMSGHSLMETAITFRRGRIGTADCTTTARTGW